MKTSHKQSPWSARTGLVTLLAAVSTLLVVSNTRAATPVVEILSPQCPLWAGLGQPMEFIVTGIDPDNDLKYCDMGVNGPLVDQKTFDSTNSGATCTFTYTFTQPGTNLVWFQAFDQPHNASPGAHCTVNVMPPPLNTNLTVLTYNTHLFENSPLECIVRCAPDLDWSAYTYLDEQRKGFIINRIRTSGVHIVAVQEVWAYSWRESFKTSLQDVYPYAYTYDSSYDCEAGLWAFNLLLPPCITASAAANLPSQDYAYRLHTQGNGIILLSKFPLSNRQFKRFPTYTQGDLTVKAAEETWADKGVMTAEADVSGTPIRIGISHALTGPDDAYSSWTAQFTAATLNTFQDANGQAYWFGVNSSTDIGIVSRFEDYSWKDDAGTTHYAAGWKQVYSNSMNYGCSAATTFKLGGATYLFGLHGNGTNAAIIRRFNDDPATGWTQTAMHPLSVNYRCLTSFELNGEPYIFMIYPPENNVYIRKINADASGWTSTYRPLSGSYAYFTPFYVGGRPYLLGTHPENNAYVYKVNDDASLTQVASLPWAVDWVPTAFQLSGNQHMFLRSYASATAHLRDVISANPVDWVEHPVTGWSYSPTDYLTMKAFEINGHPYLFGMRRSVGDLEDSTKARMRPRDAFIWRVNDDGTGVQAMFQLEDMRIIRDATVPDPNGPPAILMGDFNVHPNKYPIMDNIFKKVGAVDAYVKVHGTAEGGETVRATNSVYHYFWPANTENSRIDYVYAKDSGTEVRLEPVSAWVARDYDISDHDPLFVTFRLHEESRLEATPLPGGLCQLGISGRIGRLCEVQWSPDLTNWQKLTDLRISGSPHLCTDPSPLTSGSRFYRLQLLP